ARVLTVINQT
uniref:60S Ribosomal protein L35 n=1 Tax=Canis lupus familiaris TaxID=9615 RepID=D0VWQ7_CANLF|nr:Chain B8, 60S Ribosomal protein L35 [Canis lupus familiaris]